MCKFCSFKLGMIMILLIKRHNLDNMVLKLYRGSQNITNWKLLWYQVGLYNKHAKMSVNWNFCIKLHSHVGTNPSQTFRDYIDEASLCKTRQFLILLLNTYFPNKIFHCNILKIIIMNGIPVAFSRYVIKPLNLRQYSYHH